MSNPVCDVWLILCPKYVDGDARRAVERIASTFEIDVDRAEWLVRRMPVCVTRGAAPAHAKVVAGLLRAVGADVRIHSRRRPSARIQLAPPVRNASVVRNPEAECFVPIPHSLVQARGLWEQVESGWDELDSEDAPGLADRIAEPRPT